MFNIILPMTGFEPFQGTGQSNKSSTIIYNGNVILKAIFQAERRSIFFKINFYILLHLDIVYNWYLQNTS